MSKSNFFTNYFKDIADISRKINKNSIENLVKSILKLRKRGGRIFFIGVGGSAGNCSHAVNDFRKICGIECYTPLDNVSELTARINDDGWNSSLTNWLKTSKLNSKDAIFVFSVGGGDIKKKVSLNLIDSIKYAKEKKIKIFGIVGREKSFLNKNGNDVVVIPIENKKNITPYSESFQAIIWHSIVTHPLLKLNKTKW